MTGHLESIYLLLAYASLFPPHVDSVPVKAAVNKQHLATVPDQDRRTKDC